MIYARLIVLAALLAGLWAGVGYIHHQGLVEGKKEVQQEWDADKLAKSQAETAATLSRVKNNERIAEQQALDNAKIKKGHDDEMAAVRAANASPYRLRVSDSICRGFASATNTQSPGVGNAPATGTLALPEALERNLQDLIQEADTMLASCRAAQSFIRSNGMDK
ncbi:hypothetical protein ACO0LG_22730 [Undibacterium sp. Ji42W]|uniref:hypothetical protein n=1 Tax=Undibacterium sp. Ji42W TaxID=3413039 RepID=UPI003BF1D511